MPFFPSIKNNERLADVLEKFNTGIEKPLMLLHEALMRNDDSPFTVAERELLAAYVSGVMNGCDYCYNVHERLAVKFGIEKGMLERLIDDIDTSGVDEKLKPVLRFVRKLTLDPGRMVQADAGEVFRAGWDERALYDAMAICCTWNFMNRFVQGLGLDMDDEQYRTAAQALSIGYSPIIEKFNLK